MALKHRVQINVTDDKGNKQSVLKSGICSIPKKLLQFIIGENVEFLVLTPGHSVETVEIHEISEGKKEDEQDKIST
ncbi:hypothetical protein [Pseudolactococcus reticulitermitis]|uniref:Uncharacterized protein n=1 Tax=Pseudolactococcus reticulitermitis TaxID=2025039 RepID=A0A224XG58_9LACT|nr:hypothetical protein [Lactococcus reticulitermitis]GAX48503.1 hypothetical protein RsY01_2132 [Lactococcus reticulitermitis]